MERNRSQSRIPGERSNSDDRKFGNHRGNNWRKPSALRYQTQQQNDAAEGSNYDRQNFKNWRGNGRSRSLQTRPEQQENDIQPSHSSAQYKNKLTGLSEISQVFDDNTQKGMTPFKRFDGKRQDGNSKSNFAKPARRIGFKRLEELLAEDSDQLIVGLLSASSGFLEVLNSKLSSDYIVLIMRILSKVSDSVFTSNKTKILELTLTGEFVTKITQFIMLLPLHDEYEKKRSRYFWEKPNDFFVCFNNYCGMMLSLLPSIAVETVPKVIKAAIITLPQISGRSEDVTDMLKVTQDKIVMLEAELISKYKKKNVTAIDESEMEPPEDFRNMSLYPLPIEIVNRTKVFVRKNIIKGRYQNVEHYLDIHFRLLREDFVKPLREGICDYLEDNKKKIQNIKVYKNVRFLGPYMANAICGVLMQLDIKDNKVFKKKLENSRRFMFGSLMCFTSNNFQSIIFGKIVDRKPELLQKGQLVIQFDSGIYNIEYDFNYLMVESSVYFEPYYQVLKALKELNESNFPMRKYIIEVNKDRERPQYRSPLLYESYDSDDSDDLSDIDRDPRIAKSRVSYWVANLNEAQRKAYNSATNQCFSIIQGPPGTGKTYLGLVIAKSLLENREAWYHGRYPLLVVCFTNHALDQFLEGLLSVTKAIVRIGGQSKNKSLEPYNIRNARKSRKSAQAYFNAWDDVTIVHRQLRSLHSELDNANDFLGVVNILDTLRKEPELLGSWFETITEEEFKSWIFGGQTRYERRIEKQNIQIKEYVDFDMQLVNQIFDDPNERNFLDLDDIMLERPASSISHSKYIISINELKCQIKALYDGKNKMESLDDYRHLYKIRKMESDISSLEKTLDYLQMRMEEGKTRKEFQMEGLIDFDEPNNIHPNDRWNLYFDWLELYRIEKKQEIEKCEKTYQRCYKAYEELREIEDVNVMRQNLVVGMTTTGAARLQGSLKALKSPIVIVEEAAEIMESHVITSLTDHCIHLILIGDHKQLRPNTADFTMEKQYNLGISLFERMINNEIHCNVLSVQHRMRPEIAKLIAPNIYPQLENHESVNGFPPVRGIDSCLYFITHQCPELECGDQSKSNLHEAMFLLRLAKYLLLNGYQPEDITIIAAYSGQMFAMFKERSKIEMLKDVRITVLDNYQGEESKIILLSLVRNNENGKIGFLSLENRVCVALSRAREGLYIMGNIDMLCSHSTVWPKVRLVLEEQNSLGTSLMLRCQIHHDRVTAVSTEKDFLKVSEGGCDLICNQTLSCGHQCKSRCHVMNRDHNEYQCKEMCTKILCDNDHICPKLCFMECGNCEVPMLRMLPCGHEGYFPCYETEFICARRVSAELPCTHKVDNKPCYLDVDKFPCPYPCDTRIDTCGHACTNRCHMRDDPDHLQYKCYKQCVKYRRNCTVNTDEHICPKYCFEDCPECDIKIKKERSCSHFYKIACAADVEIIVCKRPCKKILTCGHLCKLNCSDICGLCTEKVEKTIPVCGHKVNIECSKQPTTQDCSKQCPLLLQCGHPCKNKCKQACTTKCKELVNSIGPLACGHLARIPCYLNTLENLKDENVIAYCKQLCDATLECEHKCSGSCGACYQGRIHKTCTEQCGSMLVCGHKCSIPCRQACRPCVMPCMYKCCHSKCKKKCGDICTPCKESCPRKCEHIKCRARCSDKCTVPPCTKPCKNSLPCGHLCIGFCGEPCPQLCLICNREELLDFCLGFEDEPDARFVLLQECKHVIESRGMEMWLEKGEDEINVKRCPKCRMPLTVTRRYNDYIKDSIDEIQKVKSKFFGSPAENKLEIAKLHQHLDNLAKEEKISKTFVEVSYKIRNLLLPVRDKRRQTISKIVGQILRSKIQILQEVHTLYKQSLKPVASDVISYVDFLLKRLMLDEYRMTGQEVNDFTVEIKRLRRIFQLNDIERTYRLVSQKSVYVELHNELFGYNRYDLDNDNSIKQRLKDLSKEMGGSLIVTDKEMKDIVKAIGVRNGAWYKCPNGHPYAIGECGGAMEVSRCADCGTAIGGTSHALLGTNTHFNVDGSSFAAWSERANMLNYDLE